MNPPRLATWLLQRWGSGPNHESLVGDLVERYQSGRSPAWYWRQAVKAVLVGAVHDIRDHKWLAIQAIVVSYLLLLIAGFLTLQLYGSLGLFVWNWTVIHGWDAARGWWFGQYHMPNEPSNPVRMAHFFSPLLIGWAIARLNPRHSSAMVLSCAAYWFVLAMAMLAWMPWLVNHTVPVISFRPTTIWLQGAVRYIPMSAAGRRIALLNLVAVSPNMLLGGLLGIRPRQDAPDQVALV